MDSVRPHWRLLLAGATSAALACAVAPPVAAAPAPAEFVWTDKAGATTRIKVGNLQACQETKDATSLENHTGQVVVIYTSPGCQGFGVPVPDGSNLSTPFQSVIIPKGGLLGREG